MELTERIDAYGKPAWIALMVLAFILFWPVGLALLFYLIWSGRMACGRRRGRWHEGSGEHRFKFGNTSGNSAFDEYKDETLRRLEEEQQQFDDYLERLRRAKDKAEFDQFMAERDGAA